MCRTPPPCYLRGARENPAPLLVLTLALRTRKKGQLLGGMMERWYHLCWDDSREEGLLKYYKNDKMQGTPKIIHLRSCVFCVSHVSLWCLFCPWQTSTLVRCVRPCGAVLPPLPIRVASHCQQPRSVQTSLSLHVYMSPSLHVPVFLSLHVSVSPTLHVHVSLSLHVYVF